MTPAERAFYEWWHINRAPGMSQDHAMAAFAGGWDAREPDDPPEYDPYDATADQAEDHAAGQAELSRIEEACRAAEDRRWENARAEEARDAAGEAWQASAYPSGVTDPAETSGPRGLA